MATETRQCRLAEILTTEMLIQILIRLPLESVLVSMKVCRSWNHLIRQPFFAHLHRSFSCNRPTITLVHTPRDVNLTTFGFITGDDNNRYDLNFTGKVTIPTTPDAEIVGSCNGLICLSIYDGDYYYEQFGESMSDEFGCCRLVVCNPISGSSVMLPDPPQFLHAIQGCANYGFGYIPSTCQYKVVKFIYMERQQRPFFYVCTLQRGTKMEMKRMTPSDSAWRMRLCDVGSSLPRLSGFSSKPAFFKGSIIWIVKSLSANGRFLIYFDIEKEDSQALQLPPTIFTDYAFIARCVFYEVVKIGVYYDDDGNDHLYLCEELDTETNIWVMEDYKSIDSLKLEWVIPHPEGMFVNLIKVHNNGKLLIEIVDSSLAYYDPTTGVVETMENLQFNAWSNLAVDLPNLFGCLL